MAVVLNPSTNSSSTSSSTSTESNSADICRILVDETIEKTIVLDELSADATQVKSVDSSISNKNVAGTEYPILKIGDVMPTVEQIKKLKITSDDRIPTISLSLSLTTTSFTSKNMPKDGDIISVFIAPKSETLTSIRIDFVINSVNPKKTEKGVDVSFSGVMFIPGFSADSTFGTIGTSKTAFIEAAKKYGLGFATDDEDDTNDKQLWLCANIPCEHYLNNIIAHTWKDEISFYDWWIDERYNINFINVNKIILANTKDIDITANTNDAGGDYESPVDISQNNTKATNKVFSNDPKYSSGVFFVKKWKVKNNSSEISMEEGVEIISKEFMHNDGIYCDNAEPVNSLSNVPAYDTTKTDNHIILRGRAKYDPETNPENEQARANYSFKELYVQKPWCGISYVMSDEDSQSDDNNTWFGNVNKNYTRAPYHNKINLVELDKMFLEIEVDGLCTQVMRGEVVPFALKRDNSMEAMTNQDEQTGRAERFYNGFYYVQGMSYEFVAGTPAHYITKLKLTRREWPVPVDFETEE